jgi:phospholipid/cholesterol/gamma-HCH transport system substrate-binding protein
MAFKFKHLEKIVGVFLTLVILIIVAVIILIGREQRWFEKHYQFTTKFLRGEGMSPGMQVAIKGIQIGEVKSVFLNEDNWIEVTFSVYEDYSERIRKDSVVKLKAPPLLGSKVLEIIPGGSDMPVLANGSYIWSVDTEEGARIMKEKEKMERPDELTRIIQNVERLTYNLSTTEGSLEQALYKIYDFFEMLTAEDGNLNQTLASLESITKSIEEREGSIGKFMRDDYELYNNVIEITENLNIILEDFQQLSKTMAATSPEIKAAIERSNRTMDEAIGLMKVLNENFFVRGFSSRKEPEPLPIQNAERVGGYE